MHSRPGVGKHLLASWRLFAREKRIWKWHEKTRKPAWRPFHPKPRESFQNEDYGSASICAADGRKAGRTDGRTDVHLADNYNPLKANKRAIVLFQQEMSPIRRRCRLLLPRDWPADGGLPLRTTVWGLAGQRSEQGSLQSRVCCELCLRRIIRQLIYPGICSHPVGGRVTGVNQGAPGRTLAPGEPLVVVSE